jgi:hypothetical protein
VLPEHSAYVDHARAGRQEWPGVVEQLHRDARWREVAVCAGLHDRRTTVLVATHSRVFIVSASRGRARRQVTSYPIARVFFVERSHDSDPHRCEVTVLAGRATITLKHVDRLRAWEFVNRVRSAILAERHARQRRAAKP